MKNYDEKNYTKDEKIDFDTMHSWACSMIAGRRPLNENKLLYCLKKMNLYADEVLDLFCVDDYYGLFNNKDFVLKAIEKTGAIVPMAICASSDVIKQILQDEELIRKIYEGQIHIPNFLSGGENLAVIIYQLMEHDELSQNEEFMQQFMKNLVSVTGEIYDITNMTLIDSITNVILEKCPEMLKNRDFLENCLDSVNSLQYIMFDLPEEFCSDMEIIKKYLEKGGLCDGISLEILNSPELAELLQDLDINDEMLYHIAQKIEDTNTVITHFGDDLDNKAAIYALQKWAEDNDLIRIGHPFEVKRVPAGQVQKQCINIDTGGHKGSVFKTDGTIVIDGDLEHGVKSACEALSKLGIYVPEQIVELADTKPNRVSSLDSRSGLALVRYLSGAQTFKLAEAGLLDKTLSDEQLEEFGLTEAHKKQQQIIDNAVQKIGKYTCQMPNGEKIVLSPEQILAGSSIAYEKGINYYVSVSEHLDKDKNVDGVTFAITCKPGCKLPEEVLAYGRQLVEEYRINENASGVFVSPNGQMIVAGGPKNPSFKIPNETIEGILNRIKAEFIGRDQMKSTEEVAEYVRTINDTREKL